MRKITLLALSLFLLYRGFKGMKYNLPRRWRDLLYAAVGFALVAPLLIALGLALGFMGPFHVRAHLTAAGFGLLWLKTLLGVALPEELLFRALIQNWIMQRFGFNYVSLVAAALIFGASHLDNGPGPLPNWRYMILATIAGFAFGKIFWKSETILSSGSAHALVNSVRHAFFL
jgi:membrane protease YdiL (CAAX protease family)